MGSQAVQRQVWRNSPTFCVLCWCDACIFFLSHSRLSRANNLVVTRSRTGSSTPIKPLEQTASPAGVIKQEVAKVQSTEEIKQQLEQNLKMQRAALQQKRAQDGATPKPNILKMVTAPVHGNYFSFDYFRGTQFETKGTRG